MTNKQFIFSLLALVAMITLATYKESGKYKPLISLIHKDK